MADSRWKRRVGALGVGALGAALMTFGFGAPPASAIDTHPCLPGERDVVGAVDFTSAGRIYEVWFCGDGNDPPTPNLPWGSPTSGHPCESGETDGTHKVRGEIEGGGTVTVWFCSDADAPPAPPPPPTGSESTGPHQVFLPTAGPTARYTTIEPRRVLDTRATGERVRASEQRMVSLADVVPSDSIAAAINLTADNAGTAGYLSVWDCAGGAPPTSALNVRAGGTAAAASIVGLDAERRFCFTTSVDTDVLVDVNGAYTTAGGGGFVAAEPRRIFDSRPAPVPAGTTTRITITGLGTAPTAVVLNLTAVTPGESGYITMWPCSQTRPEVSNLNFPAGIPAIANAVQVGVADRDVCVYNSTTTGFLVDFLGSYSAGGGAAFHPLAPIRAIDTRVGTGGWTGPLGDAQGIYVETGRVAAGIVGTVTAVDPPNPGYLSVLSRGSWALTGWAGPSISTLNTTDTTIANLFVSTGSSIAAVAGRVGGEHVLIDVTGYFA